MAGGGRFRCLTAGDVGLRPLQSRVAKGRTDEPVQVVDLNQVEVHDGEVADSRRRQAHDHVESHAAGANHEYPASGEVCLASLAPGANRADLFVIHWRGRQQRIVPRDRQPVADDPHVGAVATVDLTDVFHVPMTRRPGVVPGGERHAHQGLSGDLPDQVSIARLRVMIGPAHELPSVGAGMTVKQDQPAPVVLGNLGGPQDVICGHGRVAVDKPVAFFRRDNRSDQRTGPGGSGGRTIGGKT